MNTPKFAALSVMGTILIAGCVLANPVDLSAPGGELGAANSKGYLEVWREIDGVGLQLGKGSYLPLRFKFSSDPTIGGVLGPGFYLPMFEAKNVLIREGTMRAYLPCGKGLYLWRDTLDPNKFKTPDREWTGYLTGDDFVVWRDDGWKVLYHQGHLASIRSDDNHLFTWAYDSGGANVSEDGQSVLTMETNVAGQVASFVFGGKRYEVEYAERPITQMLQGQVAIKELDQALSSFKYPDGSADVFKFALTPERIPTLTFTDKEKKDTSYTWDPKSNYIATEKGPDGDWTYHVGDITQDFGSPPLSRSSSDGKTMSVSVDNKMGTYTSTGIYGDKIVTHVFETPGPLYHKVKSVEEIVNGVTTVTYKASYDELGRLIREVDRDGFTKVLAYGPNGKVSGEKVAPPSAPEFIRAFQMGEKVLLEKVAKAPNESARNDLLQQLALFYIDKTGAPEKALSLLPSITNKQEIFNVKLQSVLRNRNLIPAEKADQLKALLALYPDQKSILSNLISLYGTTPNPPQS